MAYWIECAWCGDPFEHNSSLLRETEDLWLELYAPWIPDPEWSVTDDVDEFTTLDDLLPYRRRLIRDRSVLPSREILMATWTHAQRANYARLCSVKCFTEQMQAGLNVEELKAKQKARWAELKAKEKARLAEDARAERERAWAERERAKVRSEMARKGLDETWNMRKCPHCRRLVNVSAASCLRCKLDIPYQQGPFTFSTERELNEFRSALLAAVDRFRTLAKTCKKAQLNESDWQPGATSFTSNLSGQESIHFTKAQSDLLDPEVWVCEVGGHSVGERDCCRHSLVLRVLRAFTKEFQTLDSSKLPTEVLGRWMSTYEKYIGSILEARYRSLHNHLHRPNSEVQLIQDRLKANRDFSGFKYLANDVVSPIAAPYSGTARGVIAGTSMAQPSKPQWWHDAAGVYEYYASKNAPEAKKQRSEALATIKHARTSGLAPLVEDVKYLEALTKKVSRVDNHEWLSAFEDDLQAWLERAREAHDYVVATHKRVLKNCPEQYREFWEALDLETLYNGRRLKRLRAMKYSRPYAADSAVP